jgi:hypothetical protein
MARVLDSFSCFVFRTSWIKLLEEKGFLEKELSDQELLALVDKYNLRQQIKELIKLKEAGL